MEMRCLAENKDIGQYMVIPPQNTSYNVKKYSEGFSLEGLYRRACDEHCQLYYRKQCHGEADGEGVWD